MMVRSSKQSGFTLVLGLVFVLVASMSAAVLMRGSVMQERMTANMNNKAISFMAAEAGADALRARLVGVWPISESKIDGLRGLSENSGVSGRYRVDSIDVAGGSVIAKITGHAVDGEHVLGATAIQVEFEVSRMSLPGFLTLAGNVTKFHPGNSGHLSINGGSGLAIATLTEDSETEVKRGILSESNQKGGNNGGKGDKGGDVVGNYLCEKEPCIGYVKPEDVASPWGNANELMRFLEVLRRDEKNVQVINGSEKEFDSSKSVTIVEGKTAWNGKKDYNGIIIFLGDDVVFNGSGHLEINGAIYMANIEKLGENSYQFGSLEVTMNGGNAGFSYDSSVGSSLLMPTILSWRETIETDQ